MIRRIGCALVLFACLCAAPQASAQISLLDPVTAELRTIPAEGGLYCIVPDGQGGLYLGGSFVTLGANPRRNAAHLTAAGVFDSWNPDPDNAVLSIHCVDTTVYLGGTFTRVGGQTRTRVAAVSRGTGAPTPWAPSADAQVAAIARIGNRVFIGGAFFKVNGVIHQGIAALDAATGAVLSYVPPTTYQCYSFAVRDTELFAAGEFGVFALSPTTGRHTRNMPGPNAYVTAIALDGNELFVGGGFTRIGGRDRIGIAAVSLLDNSVTAWDPMAGVVKGLAVTPTAVYACGGLGFSGGANRPAAARLDRVTGRSSGWAPPPTNGGGIAIGVGASGVVVSAGFRPLALSTAALPKPDARFPEFSGPVYATLAVGDTLYVGGYFNWVTAPLGSPTPYVHRASLAAVRISTGELLDWAPSASGPVRGIQLQGERVIVFGSFTLVAPDLLSPWTPHTGIALFERGTGALTPWNPDLNIQPYGTSGVEAIDVVNDTLYVGGEFSLAQGVVRQNGCAFDLRTGAVTAWDPNTSFGGARIAALRRVGANVYIGGGFINVGGIRQPRLAEVDAVTGALTAWRPNVSGDVRCMVRSGANLYVAGTFGGAAYSLIDRALLPWNPRAPFDVQFMAPLVGGMLVATNTNYLTFPPIPSVVWADLASGAPLATLPIYTSDRIYAATFAGGRLFVGGVFDGMNGTTDHSFFAPLDALSLPTATLTSIVNVEVEHAHVRVRAHAAAAESIELQRRQVPDPAWSSLDLRPSRENEDWVFEDRAVEAGSSYAYRLQIVGPSGTRTSPEVLIQLPDASTFAIQALTPNPSNGHSSLRWSAPTAGEADIDVLDISGRVVHHLHARLEAGAQDTRLSLPARLPIGMYLVRIRTSQGTLARRLCLVR